MFNCKFCGVQAESKRQLAIHIGMRHPSKKQTDEAKPLVDLGDNFGKQMDLMGQIHALLKVEM